MLLRDKVCIVSGIGPGIGRDVALAFARQGADVALGARTEDRLREVAAEVEALGRRAVWTPTNITDEDQCRALADLARTKLGRLDVLVNNAFVGPTFTTIESADMDSWRVAWKVNVVGTLQMTRACIPAMREAGGGSIVVVNSMGARTSTEGQGAYAATKAALLSVVRTLAREVGRDGIRVNSVLPGYVKGPSLDVLFEWQATQRGCTPQDVHDEVAAETALGRIPTGEDIANAIVFLASDLAGAMTGQALDVNCGHWFNQ
jgi:NAD(P)-dependent dehydrogenase (short-subunit alcohol dehydrogenase family)